MATANAADSVAEGPRETVIRYVPSGKVPANDATISVGVNTSAANAALDRLNQRVQNAAAATGTRAVAFAGGTNYAPGGFAVVGEQGPELIYLPKGSKVKTASETRSMMAGPTALPMSAAGGGSRYYYIAVNGLVDQIGVGRAVKQAIAAAERAGVN